MYNEYRGDRSQSCRTPDPNRQAKVTGADDMLRTLVVPRRGTSGIAASPKETQFHKPFNLPNEDSTFSEGTGVEQDDHQNSADVCLGDEPTSLDSIRGTTPDDFHTSAKSNHPDSKETILCPKPQVKDGESNIGVEVLVGNTTDMVLAGHSKDVETHGGPYNNGMEDGTKNKSVLLQGNQVPKLELADVGHAVDANTSNRSFLLDSDAGGDESGTEEEQAAFMKELETFHKENYLEFKPPRFYQEPLNLLKSVLTLLINLTYRILSCARLILY
ncbi:hypothetical protein RJ639_014263 [Escallonia herrerae]|uniref:Uncharacterized protein n=1 Tax=Escallonia herrerae TaxID=1293975 RepID=A0AA88VG05_9ASTE|nr:hypothetical protein RJ639_014263 [Escallonia herrerae]